MQLEQQESFEIKGPQLEVFGEAETRLPAAAKKRPAALAVLAVAIVASVLGIGGAQLKGQWRETSEIYTSQIDDYGNGIQQDFSNQADAAASLIRIASAVVGTDDADLQAAQTALDNWNEAADRHGLDRIFLVSPDSTEDRLKVVADNARGFVYAAARMGVTGERSTIDASPKELVARTRKAGAKNVCVGIGVSTAEQGARVGSYADGVIVGSALVHTMLDESGKHAVDEATGLKALAEKTEELAEGIHNARN